MGNMTFVIVLGFGWVYICLKLILQIMKTIIQRNLPLDVKYNLIDKKYIPLEEGCGLGCDNCNKLIANIATVKNETGEVFNIGFDCFETILVNNHLLSSGDIAEYERAKKMIPKIIRFSHSIKDVLSQNKTVTGLLFEAQTYASEYYTYYWLHDNKDTSRDNDFVKLKDMDFDFLIDNLKNIFPRLTIIIK